MSRKRSPSSDFIIAGQRNWHTKQRATTSEVVTNDNNNNSNGDNEGLLLTTLQLPLLIKIVNNLGEQKDLTNISVLSKQFYKIVHLPAIETKIIPIYEISPGGSINANNNRGSQRQFLQRLVHNRLNHNEKFSHYHHFRLNGVNEFNNDLTYADVNDITNNVPPINNIELLDLSLSSSASATSPANAYILYDMRNLLSNVQEINLSCVRFDRGFQQQCYLRDFFNSQTSLQKVTWHHCNRILSFRGFPLHPTRTKEIVSDNSLFITPQTGVERMSNLEQYDDIFMFYNCKSLERLSIRNAKYAYTLCDVDNVVGIDIPQNALIKFVQNAPSSMRLFRSDLSKENIVILQKKRPEIQLLN